MVCSFASFDLYCAIVGVNCTFGVVLRQCFSIVFEFQVIRKGCIFWPFLPFVLLFLRSCCIHSRISFSLWVNCRVGYCHCHLKCVLRSIRRVQTENCAIDKQSPYVKLLLFSKRVLLVIVSETVERAIAMLVAPLELYCAIVSGYYLSFKLSGKVVFLLGPEFPTGDGWERASHWSCIAPLEIIFLDTIWVSSNQERLWRIWRLFVIWCGEFVWQWRKFKREMWWSCFRKTLCGLKRNKGCWLNARRTKRMRLGGEVGWSIGECRFIFTMPVAGCRRIEFILARRLVKVVIAELGDWDMHAEHKQYIFKAITKTFNKPESLEQ